MIGFAPALLRIRSVADTAGRKGRFASQKKRVTTDALMIKANATCRLSVKNSRSRRLALQNNAAIANQKIKPERIALPVVKICDW